MHPKYLGWTLSLLLLGACSDATSVAASTERARQDFAETTRLELEALEPRIASMEELATDGDREARVRSWLDVLFAARDELKEELAELDVDAAADEWSEVERELQQDLEELRQQLEQAERELADAR